MLPRRVSSIAEVETGMSEERIYEPLFVRNLFDEMSATYATVNWVSSFGFCERWRRQCVEQVEMASGQVVVDLMTGMGELCPRIAARVGRRGRVVAIDYSPVMCRIARRRIAKHQNAKHRIKKLDQQDGAECAIEITEADALCSGIPSGSADVVIASFGLKTFSREQIRSLAVEVKRILKPNGRFSFIEISVPDARWLRIPYLFYLNHVIPLIGWIFMGNPDNYRMLGVYTRAFRDCGAACDTFRDVGFEVETRSFFWGCATGLVGQKKPS